MGISGLWEVLGDGEICSIADYAARFFESHKRPLRIAVDEACWRFTNLTDEQVKAIQDGEPAANPVEKTILWRILRLLKLNVQLLFVYDGPRRPWKRGKRGGGRVSFELTRLLHKMLDHLKIPYHQAPGEAEAECAKLNQLGIVDAVWSDDGDAFMFGCQTLIKQHKICGKIVTSKATEGPLGMVKVFTIDYLRDTHDLDADSLVLFAMLAGGDYDLNGLRGCGTKTASLIAKRHTGLASALCHVSKEQLPIWREYLTQTLHTVSGRAVEVPYTFPDWKALGHYRSPIVSTEAQLHTLRGLRKGWDAPMGLGDLRVFLRERFNFGTREFLKHISPIFLVRALARATDEQRRENLQYGIQLRRTRIVKPMDGEERSVKWETKISFSPLFNIQIDITRPPIEEDWSKWAAKDGTPYDPTRNLDFDILDCFLRHGLPDDGYPVEGSQASRKRKATNDTPCSSVGTTAMTSPPHKKQAGSSQDSKVVASMLPKGRPDYHLQKVSALKPKTGEVPLLSRASSSKNSSVTAKDNRQTVDPARSDTNTTNRCDTPKPKFRIPRVVSSVLLDVAIKATSQSPDGSIGLDNVDQDTAEVRSRNVAPAHVPESVPIARSKVSISSAPAAPRSLVYESTSTIPLFPGTMIAPAASRDLQQESTLFQSRTTSQTVPKLTTWKPSCSEIIDLT